MNYQQQAALEQLDQIAEEANQADLMSEAAHVFSDKQKTCTVGEAMKNHASIVAEQKAANQIKLNSKV